MPKVRCDIYSEITDRRTGVAFKPMLDRRLGIIVGVGDATAKQAKELEKREGFRVLTDAEYQAMGARPLVQAVRVTGDPLADSAKAAGAGMPPEPPKG